MVDFEPCVSILQGKSFFFDDMGPLKMSQNSIIINAATQCKHNKKCRSYAALARRFRRPQPHWAAFLRSEI